ncbi:MAG: non-heme iron oxygenase ferredoxin subunit [Alphaproteobacteria bacterium]
MAKPKVWTDVIALADLEKGWVTPATLGARKLAVYDTPDGIFVSFALCTHAAADLCDGYFDGHIIECPLHQGYFDVRNGKALGRPATRDMKVFPARVENRMVQILI